MSQNSNDSRRYIRCVRRITRTTCPREATFPFVKSVHYKRHDFVRFCDCFPAFLIIFTALCFYMGEVLLAFDVDDCQCLPGSTLHQAFLELSTLLAFLERRVTTDLHCSESQMLVSPGGTERVECGGPIHSWVLQLPDFYSLLPVFVARSIRKIAEF